MSGKRIFFKKFGGFLRGHGASAGVGVGAVLLLVVAAVLFASSDAPPKRKIPEITVVTIQPPPPEPEVLPPPEPEEVVEQEPEMIEQSEVDEPEPQPEEDQPEEEEPLPEAATDEPPDPGEPSDTLGVDAVGEGPGDGFNLVGRPGGRGLLSGRRGGGSRWGWYAYIVQEQWRRRCARISERGCSRGGSRCGFGPMERATSRGPSCRRRPAVPRSTR